MTDAPTPTPVPTASAPQPPAPDGAWLRAETDRLLDFAVAAAHPVGGYGWLGEDGVLQADQPVQTWVTCRMTHVFALGHLLGRPGDGERADAGIAALRGLLHDDVHGGWFSALDPSGDPDAEGSDTSKGAYPTAFVVLAGASATLAGRPGARELLDDALDVLDRWFWSEEQGMVADLWDRTFTDLEPYRGVNANMHTVEALLTAADATGDARWRSRAQRILERVVDGYARESGWRLPEHYDADWQPLPDYNTDERAHPFRPYGVTTGHLLEWSRLALHLRAALGDGAPPWLLEGARGLFDTAVREGWDADGREGFVYTTDFDGTPVVRNRLHWVVTEGLGAASALYQVTGEQAYADRYAQWWAHAERFFIDRERGSWHHELDETNTPVTTGTWAGKPDVYHAAQATLVPTLPLAPMLAAALAQRAAR